MQVIFPLIKLLFWKKKYTWNYEISQKIILALWDFEKCNEANKKGKEINEIE